MIDVIKDVRNEFKVKLTDKFEEEVISFLNTKSQLTFFYFLQIILLYQYLILEIIFTMYIVKMVGDFYFQYLI